MKACKNGLKKGNGAKMVKFVFNLIFENLVRILNALQLAKAKAKTQKGNNEKRVI